jgi:hypothetical protein
MLLPTWRFWVNMTSVFLAIVFTFNSRRKTVMADTVTAQEQADSSVSFRL